ncbi:ExbD/TolR family protein [Sedimentisphaera salicampi]|uniref:Biopolymer transport protein ExbD/TolR n=1 Tax=Sedimentisphaera salicampi TaxID=1941349 RepID=A0A1W6LJ95_9BACT|nr:biopolymer transporter ExbD [Sedimentisphaera salicampi]ARN55832.1 Biopolymer transport protein ExbD/TolR [Sedimentisphaera salicampi]OXU16025.1 Biopolymer transport protein ExbD/TolR [Sedimentisphaera salicampi]
MAFQQKRKYFSIRANIVKRIKSSSSGLKFQITALTDIVFLLLVFFVATTRFRPTEGELPMGLPTTNLAGAASTVLIDPLIVELDSEQEGMIIRYGENEVMAETTSPEAMDQIAANFFDFYTTQNRSVEDPLELACSEDLKWDHLAKFYNIMYGLGIENITFLMD